MEEKIKSIDELVNLFPLHSRRYISMEIMRRMFLLLSQYSLNAIIEPLYAKMDTIKYDADCGIRKFIDYFIPLVLTENDECEFHIDGDLIDLLIDPRARVGIIMHIGRILGKEGYESMLKIISSKNLNSLEYITNNQYQLAKNEMFDNGIICTSSNVLKYSQILDKYNSTLYYSSEQISKMIWGYLDRKVYPNQISDIVTHNCTPQDIESRIIEVRVKNLSKKPIKFL